MCVSAALAQWCSATLFIMPPSLYARRGLSLATHGSSVTRTSPSFHASTPSADVCMMAAQPGGQDQHTHSARSTPNVCCRVHLLRTRDSKNRLRALLRHAAMILRVLCAGCKWAFRMVLALGGNEVADQRDSVSSISPVRATSIRRAGGAGSASAGIVKWHLAEAASATPLVWLYSRAR